MYVGDVATFFLLPEGNQVTNIADITVVSSRKGKEQDFTDCIVQLKSFILNLMVFRNYGFQNLNFSHYELDVLHRVYVILSLFDRATSLN